MNDVLEYVSLYFTKWSAKTAEYVSTYHIQICTSDVTIQHMASYMVTEVTGNFGKNKTAKHCATISKARLGKKQEHHNDKWEEQLTYFKAQTLKVT